MRVQGFKASNVWYEPDVWEPSGRGELPSALVAEQACYLVIAVSAACPDH